MNKLIILLLSLAVLTSCEKKEEGPSMSYPTTFIFKQLKNTTPVRMYTKAGEVKNPALVNKFAEKWSSSYFLENKVTDETSLGKLVFTSSSTAELRADDYTKNYDIQKSGNDLILTSTKDGYVKYMLADEYYINFINGISKYKPLIYDKQRVYSPDGYFYVHTTRERLYSNLSGGELHIYKLHYTLKSGTKDYYGVKSMNFVNSFDPTGLALLRDSDTLVVQEFIVIGVKE